MELNIDVLATECLACGHKSADGSRWFNWETLSNCVLHEMGWIITDIVTPAKHSVVPSSFDVSSITALIFVCQWKEIWEECFDRRRVSVRPSTGWWMEFDVEIWTNRCQNCSSVTVHRQEWVLIWHHSNGQKKKWWLTESSTKNRLCFTFGSKSELFLVFLGYRR